MPRITVRTTTRSTETKRALVQGLTQATVVAYGVEPEMVTVQVIENEPGNWARAGELVSEPRRDVRVP